MSGTNRHIDNAAMPILVSVQGGVTVEIGDLMFLEDDADLRNDGDSTATLYAFPFKYFRTSGASLTLNKAGVKSHFIGVALDDKDGLSGSSAIKLSVGTEGKYKFPLKPARTVAPGEYFGAVGTTSASNLHNQEIMRVTGSSFALGVFTELRTHAREAEVFINTIVGLSNIP